MIRNNHHNLALGINNEFDRGALQILSKVTPELVNSREGLRLESLERDGIDKIGCDEEALE